MLGLDEIVQVNRREGPFSGKGEKIQKVSVIMAILISHDMLEEKRGALKALCNFEMIITQFFIMSNILGPDPGGFQQLHRVHQFSIKAEISRILKITVLHLFSLPGGVAVMIDVFIIVGALPEADIINDQFEVALHRLSDRCQVFELTVNVLVNDNFLHPHVFVLERFSHRIDPRRGGDFHLQAGKTFSDQIDQIRSPQRYGICAGAVNPVEKLHELSIALFRILKISKAGSIEEVGKFQFSGMAGFDIILYVFPVDLRKDKTRPGSADNIEREFAKETIYRSPMNGIEKFNIPVGSNP
jgi:hypothetical protein